MIKDRVKHLVRAAFHGLGLEVTRRPKIGPRGGPHFIVAHHVGTCLRRSGEKFVVIDAGAGGREGIFSLIWQGIAADQLTIYGFDLDPENSERLNRSAERAGRDLHFYPAGLWSSPGTEIFHLTREPDGSSFYRPNPHIVGRWRYGDGRNFTEILAVEKSFQVPVVSVASWKEETHAPDLDFLKLNVEGCELEILRGCGGCLDSVLGVHVEMSFNQTRLGAPKFRDVDRLLDENGFTFFDCLGANFVGSRTSPVKVAALRELHHYRWPSRQMFEGHFLYLRDPIAAAMGDGNPQPMSTVRVLKLAAVAEMYGQVEFAFEVLGWLVNDLRRRGETVVADEIGTLRDKSAAEYSKYL